MKIESIEFNNFRAFRGKHKIEFSTDEKKTTTLIIGENGVGKSTILNSIYWCFYGELTVNTHKKGVIRHQKHDSDNCSVKIRIIVTDPISRLEKEYIIQRTLKGSESHLLVWEVDQHGANHKKSSNPEQIIDHFLPKALSRYFLFYGEGLKEITEDAALLKEAIESFQGLTAAKAASSNILEKLNEYLRKSDQQSNKSTKRARLEKDEVIHKKALDKVAAELDKNLAKTKKLTQDFKKIDDLYGQSKDKERKSVAALRVKEEANLRKLKIDLTAFQDTRKALVKDSVFQIMNYKYANKLDDFFSESKFKGAIPFIYHEQLIHHLLKEQICICERDLTKGQKHHGIVASKLETAETADLRDRASSIQTASSNAELKNINFNTAIDLSDDRIADKLEQIKLGNQNITKLVDRLGQLGSGDGDNIEEKRNSIIKARDDSMMEGGILKQKHAQVKKLRLDLIDQIKKLVLVNESNPLILAQINFLSKAHEDIEELIATEREKGRKFIFSDMNKSLQELSAGDHRFQFLQVEGVDTYLPEILKEDGDTLILSDGEQLLKQSLFFASALIKHSRRREKAQSKRFIPGTIAPIVADAPFGFLDAENNGIAAKLLLESTDQLIIMLNSKSFSNEVEELFATKKEALGKIYIMHKKFTGTGNKRKPVTIFKESFDTASYGNKFEESTIEEFKFKGK